MRWHWEEKDAPHRMEQSSHPPQAAAERAAVRGDEWTSCPFANAQRKQSARSPSLSPPIVRADKMSALLIAAILTADRAGPADLSSLAAAFAR
jgi:hypothetical protein